jgi:hypothetical protein
MKRNTIIKSATLIATTMTLIGLVLLLFVSTDTPSMELTNGLQLTLQEPTTNKSYKQIVPLTGTITAPQGLDDNIQIQFRLKDDPMHGEWTDLSDWTQRNPTTIEFQTRFAFIDSKLGSANLQIRIYNGTVFSEPVQKTLVLENYFF